MCMNICELRPVSTVAFAALPHNADAAALRLRLTTYVRQNYKDPLPRELPK